MEQPSMKSLRASHHALALAAALALMGSSPSLQAQDHLVPAFHEYDPPATLVVPEHPKTRSKFPFIDVHAHQYGMADQDLSELLVEMDKLNMGVMVNLSGRGFSRGQNADGTTRRGLQSAEFLARAIHNAKTNAPGRFAVFTNVDFSSIGERGWTDRAVRDLETDVGNGAQGLKVYKSLGMGTPRHLGESGCRQ